MGNRWYKWGYFTEVRHCFYGDLNNLEYSSLYNGTFGYWDLMDGTDASPCKRPCLSTKVFFLLRLVFELFILDLGVSLCLKTYWWKLELYRTDFWSNCGHNWVILSKLFTLDISYSNGGSLRSLAWYGGSTNSSCSYFMFENNNY